MRRIAATSAQIGLILQLLRKVEFDTKTVTLMHTRLPGVSKTQVGMTVDTWLTTLSRGQATEVIRWLQKETD